MIIMVTLTVYEEKSYSPKVNVTKKCLEDTSDLFTDDS